MFPSSLLGLYCCPSQHLAGWALFRLVSLPPLHQLPPPPQSGSWNPWFRVTLRISVRKSRVESKLECLNKFETIFETVLGFKQWARRGHLTKKSCDTVLAIPVDTGGSHQRTSHEKILPQEESQMSYSQTVINSLVGRRADVYSQTVLNSFSRKKGRCVFIDCCQMSQILPFIQPCWTAGSPACLFILYFLTIDQILQGTDSFGNIL